MHINSRGIIFTQIAQREIKGKYSANLLKLGGKKKTNKLNAIFRNRYRVENANDGVKIRA